MNLEQFANQLNRVSRDFPKFLKKVNQEIAESFKLEAERITPVKTGMMKASWEIQNPNSLDIKLIDRMYYSGFVDLGTRKMAPRRISMRAIHTLEMTKIPRMEVKISEFLRF